MDLRKLKKLIDLVEESGIAELELTEGEEKVRICRHVNNLPQPQTHFYNTSHRSVIEQAMSPSHQNTQDKGRKLNSKKKTSKIFF